MRAPFLWTTRLLAVAATLSCGGDDGVGSGDVVPAAIIITPNHPSVRQGLTLQLTGTVVDATGREIPGLDVSWTSTDANLAVVNNHGLVTSTGELGTVEIIADHKGITEPVTLTVTRRIVDLDVTPATLTLHRNTARALAAVATDYVGQLVYSGMSFVSADPAVASVSPAGVVTARNGTGTTTITVSMDTISVAIPVTVRIVPTTLAVTPGVVSLGPGGMDTLSVEVLDSLGAPIVGSSVGFASLAPGLVTVSPAGIVTAGAGTGSGAIRVTAGALQTDVSVYVGTTLNGTLLQTATLPGQWYGVAVDALDHIFIGNVGANTLDRTTRASFTFGNTFTGPTTPLGMAVSPDGNILYVGQGGGGMVARYSTATNATLPPLTHAGWTTFTVAATADGSRIFVGSDAYVYMYLAGQTTPADSFPGANVLHLAVHPTQPLVYASEWAGGQVREYNWLTHASRSFSNGGGQSQGVAVSPDGLTLYAVSEGGPLRRWDIGTGAALPATNLEVSGFGLGVTPSRVIVAGGGGIEVFDAATMTRVVKFTPAGILRRVAVSPDYRFAVVTNESNDVYLIQ
ncbi:MAG: Ig-like domain-containing protein [Gemmatimonadetes bacterium]|nr:Ig-like domain-containing protein [Gemmatimonadota bacterium]